MQKLNEESFERLLRTCQEKQGYQSYIVFDRMSKMSYFIQRINNEMECSGIISGVERVDKCGVITFDNGSFIMPVYYRAFKRVEAHEVLYDAEAIEWQQWCDRVMPKIYNPDDFGADDGVVELLKELDQFTKEGSVQRMEATKCI